MRYEGGAARWSPSSVAVQGGEGWNCLNPGSAGGVSEVEKEHGPGMGAGTDALPSWGIRGEGTVPGRRNGGTRQRLANG